MLKHSNNKEFKLVTKSRIIIALIILIAFVPIFIYAKYIDSISGKAKANVSTVYYSIEQVSEATNIMENRVFKDVYFNINNYDENNNLNGVLMKYYLNLTVPNTNFPKDVKLFYQNSSNNWVEIPKIAAGNYAGNYEGEGNLEFISKKTHKYKIEVVSTDNILVDENFNIDVDLKLMQTQN